MITKICRKCKKEKDISLFNKLKKRKDGHRSYCRACDLLSNKTYRLIHKEEILIRGREYYKTHREERLQYEKDHKTEANARKRKYVLNNPQKRLEQSRNYYYKNKGKRREYEKLHREEINLKRRIYNATHPQARIAHNLRSRICAFLGGRSKGGRLQFLLGCDLEFFKNHLESLFEEGMTWNNYGCGIDKWSIDHIKPLLSFNLEVEIQQKVAFNWTNCKPMWYCLNASKSARYNGTDYRNKKSQ